MQDKAYDKRTIKRYIKKGITTSKDYERHIKSLDDLTGSFEVINVEDSASTDVMPTTEDYKE